MPNPLILIHGYSDKGDSFKNWKQKLIETGRYAPADVHICSYRSLTNEVTIKDIAEGFDRALRIYAGIKPNQSFDAMVHSTGMLVLRSWLTLYSRAARVKRIIALAPASFGSPLAHKGRSWLGAIFKGNRERGPDFMEAGDLVLDGLELGSKFTWDLAHTDLLGEKIFYGSGTDTPFIFTFCGNKQYGGLRGAITSAPGTDGTVRWAGCTLNTRKILLDFTKPPTEKRFDISDWKADERTNLAMPLIPLEGYNHASIIEEPGSELVQMVTDALEVENVNDYTAWIAKTAKLVEQAGHNMQKWQQFIVHATDERGDGIKDFNLQLYKCKNGGDCANDNDWEPVRIEVHAYSTDNSYRSFHVNLDDLRHNELIGLKMEFMASSGTNLLGYLEYIPVTDSVYNIDAQPTFSLDLTPLLNNSEYTFFYPFTTTLLEVKLNREPLPPNLVNKVMWFD